MNGRVWEITIIEKQRTIDLENIHNYYLNEIWSQKSEIFKYISNNNLNINYNLFPN